MQVGQRAQQQEHAHQPELRQAPAVMLHLLHRRTTPSTKRMGIGWDACLALNRCHWLRITTSMAMTANTIRAIRRSGSLTLPTTVQPRDKYTQGFSLDGKISK